MKIELSSQRRADFGSERTVELFGGKLLLTEKTTQEPINFVDGLLDHMFLNL